MLLKLIQITVKANDITSNLIVLLQIACQTCGADFLSERKLQAHIRLEHEGGGNDPGAKNYLCDW